MATNILDVMKAIEKVMEPLPDALRKQVIRWAIKKYTTTTDETDTENIMPHKAVTERQDDAESVGHADGAKTGIFYFDKKGGMVVNPRKYIDRIRHETDDEQK